MDIGDNIIDSRDVIKEIEELRSSLCDTPFGDDNRDSSDLAHLLSDTPSAWEDHFDKDDVEKLIHLLDFEEQGSTYAQDWRHGATFILDEYFETYAKEYASEIGCVPEGYENYFNYEAWANDLQVDYTSIEVDGNTYWTNQ